jgi:ubiquinone/menaquinone biosynthesis C-methylase UbiE
MTDPARRYWEGLFDAMEGERSARSSAWLDRHLKALARTGPRLVDLGCGTGDDVRVLAREGFRTVGLDFAWAALAFARDMFPRGHYVQADLRARRLPFRDAAFDAVIARCSLHYFTLAQTQRIVDEVARVLVPGGAFAFVINSAEHLRRKLRYDYAHAKTVEPRTIRFQDGLLRHFFSETEIKRLLRGAFEIEYVHEGPFRQYEEQRIAWTVRARSSNQKPTSVRSSPSRR